jgi:endogenous inhibitor of DNA gyrase (YacG/DUF329 family)
MMINLRELMIECPTCGCYLSINSVRRFGENWVTTVECSRCEENAEREIEDNYADFVQNGQTTLSEFTQNQEPSRAGRPVGSISEVPRGHDHCSRCGAAGRRISKKRGFRCVECPDSVVAIEEVVE